MQGGPGIDIPVPHRRYSCWGNGQEAGACWTGYQPNHAQSEGAGRPQYTYFSGMPAPAVNALGVVIYMVAMMCA